MPVILTFGDSNTHGTPPVEGAPRFGLTTRWPRVMLAALGPDWHLIEEGHGGRTTVHPDPIEGLHKNGIAALPIMLDSHRPIDVITIMLGTNDLKERFSVNAADIAQSCEQLILMVRASDAGPQGRAPQILLIAPPPVLEVGRLAMTFRGGAAKSKDLAAACRAVAEAQGVAFLDAGSVIRSSPLDGIHFDETEHGKLGRAVARAVLDLKA
jgi:lysophospholipase L1-like esterase